MEEQEVWKADVKDLYAEFNSSKDGLSSAEVQSRLQKYGRNAIPDKDRREWFDILIAQFNSPLLLILIFASIVAAYMGDIFDTYIILATIGVSVALGFAQEYKSEKTLNELKKYFRHHAVVLRNGEKVQKDASELVPGDIAFVGLGDIVPADMRIIETDGISMDEAVLTGESREVKKAVGLLSGAISAPQGISNGLFMGTTVVDGYAKALVVRTGQSTYFGRTVGVFSSKVPESDFQAEIRKFGGFLFKVIIVLTVVVFLANFALGHGDTNPLTDSALFALALAIGIAPEALPVIITITLSNGSLHLAKKKVITKKLAAIEDLGNMDILCTDKTGTLTEGDIAVEKFVGLDGKKSDIVFKYSFLCNSAVGSTRVRGNPIDVAIRSKGLSSGIDVSGYKKIDLVPFDFERRRMGQLVSIDGKQIFVVKGAPESTISVCSKAVMGSRTFSIKEKEKEIHEFLSRSGDEGYTTVAVAVKELNKKNVTKDDENGLTLLGFVLLSNPVKPSVKDTLERMRKLGVRLKLLTGDDPRVTKKICTTIGFCEKGVRIVLGSELAAMSKEEFAETVERFDVFARIAPEQKLLIVEKLRDKGHIVGFLGDGINDAPALRAADVGISVESAADVAKGASHIILLHKSLGVVCDGVEEGRKIFGNITKYILNTMSANQGNMLTVTISSFFLPFIPLLPSQILLNNFLSDLPMLSISSDKVDSVYTRKPQHWNISMIFRFMLFFGAISTIFDFILIATMYFFMGVEIAVFRTAWFLESALSEMIIVFALRTRLPFLKSTPSSLLIWASLAGIAIAFAFVYISPLAELFHLVPLDAPVLILMTAVLVGFFIATEIGKMVYFDKEDRK